MILLFLDFNFRPLEAERSWERVSMKILIAIIGRLSGRTVCIKSCHDFVLDELVSTEALSTLILCAATRPSGCIRIQNTNPALSFYAQLIQRVVVVSTVHTSIQPSIQAQWIQRRHVVSTVYKCTVETSTSIGKYK